MWVVANYNPPGNIIGLFEENVPKVGTPMNTNTVKEYKMNTPVQSKLTPISDDAYIEFTEQILAAHNKLRKRHESPPVVLNYKLNTYAQSWATVSERLKNMHTMY